MLPARFKGLRIEIVGNLGFVSLIALILTGLGVWLLNGRHVLQENVRHGQVLIESLARELAEAVPASEPEGFLRSPAGRETIELRLKRCQEEDPRLNVFFVSPWTGAAIAAGGAAPGALETDQTVSQALARGITRVRLEGRAPALGYVERAILASPVAHGEKLLGGVVAGLALENVRAGARQTVSFILLYMGLGTLVQILFGTIMISRTLVRPLKRIIAVMQDVTGGDLTARVPSPGDNELGLLAGTFNRMADTLKANQKAIQDHVNALQRINRELKQSQQEVIQSEKLASVGLLAAGVAHEVGNPLGAVLGYIRLLEIGAASENERRDYLQRMEGELQRIHRIVGDLQDYSRPSRGKIAVLDVNNIVQDTVTLVSRLREFQGARFELSLSKDLPGVRLDESQLQQVLVNLFLNARDAVHPGGQIAVATSRTRFSPPLQAAAGERPRREDDPPGCDFRLLRRHSPARKWPFLEGQDLVEIKVTDNGTGIPVDRLPRVFDPFFTTKETGRGTGLGLAVSQRIIESFYGVVEIASTWGLGTEVKIQLPAADVDLTASQGYAREDTDGAACTDCR